MIDKCLTLVAGFACGFAIEKLLTHFLSNKKPKEQKNEKDHDENFMNDEVTPSLGAVFLIRKDLGMGKGKEAAQCGHATLGLFRKVLKKNPSLCAYWYDHQFPKLYYYVADERQMNHYLNLAVEIGLCVSKIRDAGRTQIAPGSATVLAVGPIDMETAAELFINLNKIK